MTIRPQAYLWVSRHGQKQYRHNLGEMRRMPHMWPCYVYQSWGQNLVFGCEFLRSSSQFTYEKEMTLNYDPQSYSSFRTDLVINDPDYISTADFQCLMCGSFVPKGQAHGHPAQTTYNRKRGWLEQTKSRLEQKLNSLQKENEIRSARLVTGPVRWRRKGRFFGWPISFSSFNIINIIWLIWLVPLVATILNIRNA